MIQSLSPERLLGRVSSVTTSLVVAMAPVGALVGGVVAEQADVPVAVVMGGTGLLFVAGYALAHPGLRSLDPVDEVGTLGP